LRVLLTTKPKEAKMFILHRGGQQVNKDELDLIPVPAKTDSYQPVSHYDLADKISTIGQDLLTDYVLVGENYGVARQGNQMFAVLKFQREKNGMALSVAFGIPMTGQCPWGLLSAQVCSVATTSPYKAI
jgi:hypothetical protein